MSADERDGRIAAALSAIDVPDHEPDFWGRLDARLAEEPRSVASSPDQPIALTAADASDDLVVVPLARRARRTSPAARRGIAVLAAAAAIVVAVLAVQLATDDGGDQRVAQQPDITTPAPDGRPGERLPAPLGEVGSTATPQDAFATWVAALAEGDAAVARSLLGPHTVAYYEALGGGIDQAGEGYEVWSDVAGLAMSVIDFGEVAGEPVAGVIVHRPDSAARYGTRYLAIPLVQTDDGWRVEPAAFDPDAEGRLEPVQPGPGEQGLTSLPAGDPVKVQVQGAGVYYVGVDERALAGFVPADADDGILTYVPDPSMSEGVHLLVLAHLSPTVLTIQADPFEVTPTS